MELLKLFWKESPLRLLFILALSLAAGVSGGVLVPLVIYAAEEMLGGGYRLAYVAILPGVAVVLILAKRIAQSQTANLTETALEKLIVRLANTLRQAEMAEFEACNRAEIYVQIMNAHTITDAATKSIEVFQNMMIVAVCWLYIFRLSAPASVIFLAAGLFIVMMLEVFQKVLTPLIHQETDAETRLFELFQHLLKGFKEMKLNRRKNDDLFAHYLTPLVKTTKAIRTRILFYLSEDLLFVFVCFYLVMGSYVFFLAWLHPSAILIKLITLTLYLTTPIVIIHDALPYITNGRVALQRLVGLAAEIKLNQELPEQLYRASRESITHVQDITLENVRFEYPEQNGTPGFTVGPLSLTLRGGEILFLTGGNGSGKSTLLKLLTGLYRPGAGVFKINDKLVNMSNHRYLFAAVFSDFHLFDSIYGVDGLEAQQVERLLRQMELAGKTQWRAERFSTLDLSTGQKKRLAFIIALLEDKPIYVFDEWAADQDPVFRRYFYAELLPALKAQGKTIIAVTHDEKYYPAADRIIKMDYGQLVADAPRLAPAPSKTGQRGGTAPESTTGARVQPAPPPRLGTMGSYRQGDQEEPPLSFRTVLQNFSFAALAPTMRMAALAGLFETVLMVMLYALAGLSAAQPKDRLLVLFVITLLVYIIAYRKFNRSLFAFVEDSIAASRVNMADQVRNTALQSFETLGGEYVYTALTFDVKAISEISHLLSTSVQVSIYTLSALLYLLYLSPVAFGLIAATGGIIGVFYGYNQIAIRQTILQVRRQEKGMLAALNHLLDGFKELRLNDRKSDAFFQARFKAQVAQMSQLRRRALQLFGNNYTLAYSLWETLIVGLALLLPVVGITSRNLAITLIGIILFLPISVLIEHFPRLIVASLSMQRLAQVQQTLAGLARESAADLSVSAPPEFQELRYEQINFQYADTGQRPFALGPLSLAVTAGEIIFLTGGNGSGKSTLLKLLTGLYHIQSGRICLNGQEVRTSQHRPLFAAVFADFHLFDRLYGLDTVDADRAATLLKQMQLDAKVYIMENAFSTVELSTGQQKRLALVAAILEDKPIYVFDEWAADQDPQFRRYFYEELLPEFKAQGKTVIAATHDDAYFHAADRILTMEYGQIITKGDMR